ncbi:hypothetical protein [Luteibacter sp. CQ10]|uniref:hypothetical protein n=1 Tax=Luteibacter sp. CQ10 TaxID=2805821 RepID=UPI0034A47B8B
MRFVLRIFLVLMIAAGLAGCHRTADEAQVREAIAASLSAAEAGHAGDAVNALSDGFDGNVGQLDKRGLGNLIRVLAFRGRKIHALTGPVSVERRGERMIATFTVTLAAGSGLLPDDAGAYRVESGWRKEDGEWRCFTATWSRAL